MDKSETELYFETTPDDNASEAHNINNLPPEVKQQLEEAMKKLQDNPNLFSMMGALGNLAKTANKIGITQITGNNNIKNMTQLHERISGKPANRSPESSINQGLSSQPTGQAAANTFNATANSANYARNNLRRSMQPTFNPDVKGDTTRIKIFILGGLILAGYLIFQYGFQGQIPQELIDFLNS